MFPSKVIAQLVKHPPANQETLLASWVGKIPWRRDRLPTSGFLGFTGSSAGKRIHLQCRRPWFDPWVGKSPWRRDRLPTPVFLGFPCGSADKGFACSVGDLGLIPGLGRSPGEGKAYPLQYSGLENSMDCIVHGVAKSQRRLSDFHFH